MKGKFIAITMNEYLNNNKETLEEFYNRFKKQNINPDFLINNFKNPDFILKLTHDGDVKTKKYYKSESNKCETNVFNFIKDAMEKNIHHYYPVSGWAFLESTTYYEHFWIYDDMNDEFIDITITSDLPYAYGGVINKNINTEILNANKYNEINFLLGKTGNSLYNNYTSNASNPKLTNNTKQSNLEFIHKNNDYKDLSQFITDNNIHTLKELTDMLPKLEELLYNTRNNRDFEYYNKLITQIGNLKK